ncbi:unnamed protein product [Polarella glacialis]|uniref:Uncharacterized protein n=1 Tax=Polarella glacialis TaxID=89957 RepID=A0A813J325_POLGL|nr:unnamed protein product [Polarella glacialis]CAE8669454.1 unnamed protein product [Polarella glacialis]
MANPNSIMTSAGQQLWTQRIKKEEAVNAQVRRDGFSVRSALKSLNVPEHFKPGQVNPSDILSAMKENANVGLDRDTERALRADLAARKAPPQDQLLWPETSQHHVGWLAQIKSAGLPLGERGTLVALSPRVGLGWLDSPRGGASSSSAQQPKSQTLPPITPRLTPRQSQLLAGMSPAAAPGLRSAVKMDLPDPWGLESASPTPRPGSKQDRAMAEALQRSRQFLNGPSNPYYRPKGSSDVVAFADLYAKEWGTCLFKNSG